MTQDEYTLTSSDEAFALGEQGRRILLDMAVTAHIQTFAQLLRSLKDWERTSPRAWTTATDSDEETRIATMAKNAFKLFIRACCVTGWDRQVDLLYISDHVAGRRAARSFFNHLLDDTRGRAAFIQGVVALSAELREAGHANLLEAAYAATDPTLAPDYASMLMPSVPGRP